MSEQREQAGRTHTVRPRWTWVGLLVMLVGLVLVGVGISLTTWTWAVPGLVLFAVGGGVALYGGLMYDVRGGSSARVQMQEVVEGREYEFPGAGTKRSEEELKQDVRRRWLDDDEQ
jgi:hypothetical protein